MDNGTEPEKISLWGVLHDGELREIKTDAANQTADLHVVVPYLSEFFGWPDDAGIRFHFGGVIELRVNQWVPDPAKGSEDIRSRRWSRREWMALEQAVPPNALEILEASFFRLTAGGGRIEVAGYELGPEGNSTDIWLEIIIQGTSFSFATPEGPCDLERLLQVGDAYWDNVGKKRKR
jgi:hypothetical protein